MRWSLLFTLVALLAATPAAADPIVFEYSGYITQRGFGNDVGDWFRGTFEYDPDGPVEIGGVTFPERDGRVGRYTFETASHAYLDGYTFRHADVLDGNRLVLLDGDGPIATWFGLTLTFAQGVLSDTGAVPSVIHSGDLLEGRLSGDIFGTIEDVRAVPEPSSLLLLSVAAVAFRRRLTRHRTTGTINNPAA